LHQNGVGHCLDECAEFILHVLRRIRGWPDHWRMPLNL
jgi:hypothetical protein